jgi:hypothetical protein
MSFFEFPKIILDPSKITGRWQLAGLCLIVWIIIAYSILTRPVLNIGITLIVLTSTLVLLLLVLMLSFKLDIQKPEQSTQTDTPDGKQLTGKNIATVIEAMDYIKENPHVQQALENRKIKKSKKTIDD